MCNIGCSNSKTECKISHEECQTVAIAVECTILASWSGMQSARKTPLSENQPKTANSVDSACKMGHSEQEGDLHSPKLATRAQPERKFAGLGNSRVQNWVTRAQKEGSSCYSGRPKGKPKREPALEPVCSAREQPARTVRLGIWLREPGREPKAEQWPPGHETTWT